MKRLFLTAMLMAAAACSSNTNNSGSTGTGATDVTTGTGDAKTGTGDATSDSTSGGADAADAVDAKADATKDVPPAPVLCKTTDQACLLKCGNEKCDAPQKACEADKGCKAFEVCLTGCAQKPPVAPPDDVTGTTCEDKCVTLAKEATGTMDKYQAIGDCLYGTCVECGAKDTQCIQLCEQGKCHDEIAACSDDPECGALLQCLNDSKCTDQACAQKACGKYLTQNAIAGLQDAANCLQEKEADCKPE